jgi:hypothetical protein
MTLILRAGSTLPGGRRGRTLTCALRRQEAGTLPTVCAAVIAIGIVLLILVALDLGMVIGVLV